MKLCKKGLHQYEPKGKRPRCPHCAKAGFLYTRRKQHDSDNKRKGEKLMKYWPNLTGIEALNKRNQMFADQQGNCAICGKNEKELSRCLMIDHSHETGQVRGLLCQKCNSAEGFLGTVKNAEALVKYMRAYQ